MKRLKVTLIKSIIGRPGKHRKVLLNLGLTKLNKSIEINDTPVMMGMINKVSHLLKIEENKHES